METKNLPEVIEVCCKKKAPGHLGDEERIAGGEVLLLMGQGQALLQGGSPHIHLRQ